MNLEVTEAEHSAGAFDADKLAAIIARIRQDGFAVVGNIVSSASCRLLMESVLEDAQLVRAQQKPTQHEERTGQGHLQLGLRRYAPFVRADLVANPLIEQIVATLLGPDAWLGFYNGNVNLPGSTHQPLHFDRPFSWATQAAAAADGQPWPPPTTTLSCSVALAEITEANGATEIYPGTHRETIVTQWPAGQRVSEHPEVVERWGPPQRMPIPAGGICFRDPRMWHRGVPNPSDQARPMIALTYHAHRCKHWRGRLVQQLQEAVLARCRDNPALKIMDDGSLGDGRLVFEESTREAFEQSQNRYRIYRNVRFVAPQQKVNHFLDAHLLGGARVVDSGAIGPA